MSSLYTKFLYKRDNLNKIQQWRIEVEDNKYRTVSGEVDGKLTTTKWTVCEGKNVGRANETSPQAQAEKEAIAKVKKKLEEGYTKNIKDVDTAQVFEVMLAKNYEDYKDELTYPLFCQPKLDGIRCRISKDGMWTRNNKQITSCPHIQEAVAPIFKDYPTIHLDGELYNHKFKEDFNRICELVKRTKLSDEHLTNSKKYMQYWWYDVVTSGTFEERSKIMEKLFSLISDKSSDFIIRVPTSSVDDEEELTELYEKYLDKGYEGQMVRCNEKYEHKRSKYLLKRKEFKDEEYEILEVVKGEGERTGLAGAMRLKTKEGLEFKSNIKGSFEWLAQLLNDAKTLVGKQATVKFFNLTPDGIPRFPYVIKIRDYE